MQRLCPPKKMKNCFGHWTDFVLWSGIWLCTKGAWVSESDFQRSWFHPWSPKKKINCFWHWTVSMCWSGVWLWRLKTDPLTRVGVTLYNSSLVLICDAKIWSQKKGKNCFGYWTVFMRWSGVWLCTRDGRLKTDPLRRVGVTLYNSSSVLICDAKTWSPKKRGKTVSDTGLSLCADLVFDFVQEMGDLKLTH